MDQKVVYIRKSPGKTAAIVILLLLLFCAISYIGYTEYQKLLDSKKITVKKERTELYYSEVQSLLSRIDLYNNVLASTYPIKDINKIDNQLKLKFAVKTLKEEENVNNYYNIDDIKQVYSDYFKNGFSAIYEDIKNSDTGEILYKLDNNTKTYTLNGDNGIINSVNVDTFYVSGKIDEKKYVIKTNLLYSNICLDTCPTGYFDSYEACLNGDKPIANKKSEYQDIKQELPVVTYTFSKVGTNYKLESVDIDL